MVSQFALKVLPVIFPSIIPKKVSFCFILFEIRLFSDQAGKKKNTVIINLIEFKRSVLFKSFEESIILNETC